MLLATVTGCFKNSKPTLQGIQHNTALVDDILGQLTAFLLSLKNSNLSFWADCATLNFLSGIVCLFYATAWKFHSL